MPVSGLAAALVAVGLTSFRLTTTPHFGAAQILASPRSALGATLAEAGGTPASGAPSTATGAAPVATGIPDSPRSVTAGTRVAAFRPENGAPRLPEAEAPAPAMLDPLAPDEVGALQPGLAVARVAEGPSSGTGALASATPAWTPPAPGRIILIGDSVMLGALRELRERFGPQARVDAEVSRQFSDALAMLSAWRTSGLIPSAVVIHLGSNGAISAAQFDDLMAVLDDVPRVYFVTVKVPRRWESPVNEALVSGVRRWPKARLIDWHAVSYRQRYLFRDDGFHVTREGAQFYADVLALSVAEDFATGQRALPARASPTPGEGGANRAR